jgi:hypothetical protein
MEFELQGHCHETLTSCCNWFIMAPGVHHRLGICLVVTGGQYQEKDLVSSTEMEGTNPPDPNLRNPWGMARGTDIFWWVSDNVTGASTLYDGSGVRQTFLTVTIPHTSQTSVGSPTGIVFNGSHDFAVATGKPGIFIFVSLDGTISAWNPNVNFTHAIQVVPGSTE